MTLMRMESKFERPELELPTEGPRRLLTWDEKIEDDGHIPTDVVQTIVAPLQTFGSLVWASASFDGPIVPWSDPPNVLETIAGEVGLNRALFLRTGDPLDLFDTAGYDWHLRGQLALVLRNDITSFPRTAFKAAMGTRDVNNLTQLWAHGASFALMPGVDGGCAGIYAEIEETLKEFDAVLAKILPPGLQIRCS